MLSRFAHRWGQIVHRDLILHGYSGNGARGLLGFPVQLPLQASPNLVASANEGVSVSASYRQQAPLVLRNVLRWQGATGASYGANGIPAGAPHHCYNKRLPIISLTPSSKGG
jgi:hypothetical protein